MISEFDKAIIISLAKKIDVNTVFLFGSSLDEKTPASDIDLGVKGIAPINFSNFTANCSGSFQSP
jgi:predicted nucleotidyltransferase